MEEVGGWISDGEGGRRWKDGRVMEEVERWKSDGGGGRMDK